jgi:hypothetical protein
MSFGLEWGMRYTFTDYLDDVSGVYFDNETLKIQKGNLVAQLADRSDVIHVAGTQRGNSKTHDWYSFAVVWQIRIRIRKTSLIYFLSRLLRNFFLYKKYRRPPMRQSSMI